MRRKKFERKLELNKQTIAHLNEKELAAVKGGDILTALIDGTKAAYQIAKKVYKASNGAALCETDISCNL